MSTVDHELSFQDKYLFYRFLDDEEEDAVLPSDDEKREAEEELQETLLFLSQIGPDAHMRMILRKPWVTNSAPCSIYSYEICILVPLGQECLILLDTWTPTFFLCHLLHL